MVANLAVCHLLFQELAGKMGGLLGAMFLSAWMPKALWYLGVVLQNVRV